jgi:hypothetical protein
MYAHIEKFFLLFFRTFFLKEPYLENKYNYLEFFTEKNENIFVFSLEFQSFDNFFILFLKQKFLNKFVFFLFSKTRKKKKYKIKTFFLLKIVFI